MKLSEERIISLRKLLQEQYGVELTDTQAHEAALSVMRFVLAKLNHHHELTSKENEDATA